MLLKTESQYLLAKKLADEKIKAKLPKRRRAFRRGDGRGRGSGGLLSCCGGRRPHAAEGWGLEDGDDTAQPPPPPLSSSTSSLAAARVRDRTDVAATASSASTRSSAAWASFSKLGTLPRARYMPLSFVVEKLNAEWTAQAQSPERRRSSLIEESHQLQWDSADDATTGLTSNGDSSILPLPEFWTAAVSQSTGETYYVNTLNGESTYERPPASADGGSKTDEKVPSQPL